MKILNFLEHCAIAFGMSGFAFMLFCETVGKTAGIIAGVVMAVATFVALHFIVRSCDCGNDKFVY